MVIGLVIGSVILLFIRLVIPSSNPTMHKSVAIWLLACCALVFAMVVVGGVTRLTESGLSIVEWQPLIGTVPPLSQNDWEELF